jgi:uridine kinase
MSQRPLLFGIAGDSGSGKDSLALAIAGLFGEQAVASVSGDDYHNWDRGRPMWSVVTHLNPRANNLQRMADDVLMLASGLTMNARHYDHKTGRFTKPRRISFNDVIIVSGLHTLLVPSLRRNFDVSIFLGMDEELRRYFKIRRDIGDRGHSPAHVVAAIERRVADADLFISPQREYADVIFSLNPVDRVQLADPLKHREVRLKLVVLLRKNLSCEALVRALIGLCGLRVDATFLKGSELVELVVDGDVDSEDIAFAAGILIPDIEELISLEPKWEGGMTGIMQLISLAQAAYAIRSVDLG